MIQSIYSSFLFSATITVSVLLFTPDFKSIVLFKFTHAFSQEMAGKQNKSPQYVQASIQNYGPVSIGCKGIAIQCAVQNSIY